MVPLEQAGQRQRAATLSLETVALCLLGLLGRFLALAVPRERSAKTTDKVFRRSCGGDCKGHPLIEDRHHCVLDDLVFQRSDP